MKRVRRWGLVVVVGALPSLPIAASSCVTNLSYTPTLRESGPDVPDLTPPVEVPDECKLVVSTKDIDFTPIIAGRNVLKSFSVKNLSTNSIEVHVDSTETRFTVSPQVFPLGPSKTQAVEVSGTGSAGESPNGTLKVRVTSDGGPECSTAVAVHGTVSDRARIVGPQPLDLGSVPCKTAPPPKDLVIDSVKADLATFTASVPAPFDVAPKSGSLPTDGPVTLKVTSAKLDVQAGTVLEKLSLALSVDGGPPVVTIVDVKAVAVGANLRFVPDLILLTRLGDTQNVDVENTGNDPITVALTPTPQYGFTPANFTLAAFPAADSKKTVVVSQKGQNGLQTIIQPSTSDGTLCATGTLTIK